MSNVEITEGHPSVPDWSSTQPDGRVRCELCPRYCTMKEGQRGFCFVRGVARGQVVLTSYGRASGFCIDPIEKKPLDHFLPGTSVLSFGTAGCNLGCRFCQNHDISKAREMETLADAASPRAIAEAAVRAGCRSIACTYNDPVIFAEYAIDTAQACRERGVASVAVSAGYITEKAREPFFGAFDAANIDLKAFTEDFYRKVTFSQLQPVLDTLAWIAKESKTWLEITTLLIPGLNDAEGEVAELSEWVVENCGPEVPLHFSGFHPDFKMTDIPATPAATLARARTQAIAAGLKHVYTGNVHDRAGQSTYCAGCGALLIGRDWFALDEWNLDPRGACSACGRTLAGRFEARPGQWGSKRRRLVIHA